MSKAPTEQEFISAFHGWLHSRHRTVPRIQVWARTLDGCVIEFVDSKTKDKLRVTVRVEKDPPPGPPGVGW